MKLQSIDSAQCDGGSLSLIVSVTPMNQVFDDDGNTISIPGDPESFSFCYRPSDPYGLSPQVGKYLREHKSGFAQDVRNWIEVNLIAEDA